MISSIMISSIRSTRLIVCATLLLAACLLTGTRTADRNRTFPLSKGLPTSSLAKLITSNAAHTGSAQPASTPPDASTRAAIAQLKQRGLYASFLQVLQQTTYRARRLPHHDGYVLANPGQRLQATCTGRGVRLVSTDSASTSWQWGLRLTAVGYGSHLRSLPPATASAQGSRVSYQHAGLTEWYENRPEGLEQGFTLAGPLEKSASGPLRLVLVGTGSLRAVQQGSEACLVAGQGVGSAVLRYGALQAWDARHHRLPARMKVSGKEIALEVEDRGARYPLTLDPLIVAASPLLHAADAAQNDFFGSSISVSGDALAVGVPNKAGRTGAVYVFVRNGATWTQQQELTASDAAQNDFFGYSVSLAGDTLAVGAYGKANGTGAVYLFTFNGTTWTQQQELTASDAAQNDFFGGSVSLSGDTLAVGKAAVAGAAYVFVRIGTTWTQQQRITATDTTQNDGFGDSVSVSGDTLAVGASRGSFGTGAAYVFVRSGTTWTQQQKLIARDGVQNDFFGAVVALSGDTLAVGSPNKANPTGAVYVFTRIGTTWTLQQELTSGDGAPNDGFGNSFSLSGNTLAIGAFGRSNYTGAVYVFVRSGTIWTQQQELTASNGAPNDEFGAAVSVDGDTLAVGAPGTTTPSGISDAGAAYTYRVGPELNADDGTQNDHFGSSVSVSGDTLAVGTPDTASGTGTVYLFTRSGILWDLQQQLTVIDGKPGDNFGASVALSGDTLAIGAPNKFHARGNEVFAGNAYVFTRTGTTWTLQQKLAAADAAANDHFGGAVSVSGDTVAVGAYGKAGAAGAVYVFVRSGTIWTQQQELTASDAFQGDSFGYSVSLAGDTLAVGAYGKTVLTGAVYVFTRSGTTWTQQQELAASNAAPYDAFGYSVSLSADAVAVGAPYATNDAGAVYVFVRNGAAWTQQKKLTPSDAAPGDTFGAAVSLCGNNLAVGAPNKATLGVGYLFTRSGAAWTQRQELIASDGARFDGFGASISANGDTVAAGAPGKTFYTGAAYVYGASPTLLDQTFQTASDLRIPAPGLLANDYDADGSPLTALDATQPEHGTVTVNPDGSFQYRAKTGYTGEDGFFYTAVNANGDHGGLAFVRLTSVAPVLSTLTLTPSTVVGGEPVTGTVSLSEVASVDTVITLSTTNRRATLPPGNTVTIAAGESSATFTLTTTAPKSNSVGGVVTATLGSVSLKAKLTITP